MKPLNDHTVISNVHQRGGRGGRNRWGTNDQTMQRQERDNEAAWTSLVPVHGDGGEVMWADENWDHGGGSNWQGGGQY